MRHCLGTRRAGFTVAILVILGIPAGPVAYAHNQVLETSPGPGEQVTTSPLEVRVITVEPMFETDGTNAGFAITVTDGAGLYYGDGCVGVEGQTLFGAFDLGGSGTYTLTYQFVSADGHTVSDQYDFVFDPPAGHEAAEGAPSAPVCGESASEQIDGEPVEMEPIAEPVPEPHTDEPEQTHPDAPDSAIGAPGILTALVAALVAASSLAALWWIIRRRGPR